MTSADVVGKTKGWVQELSEAIPVLHHVGGKKGEFPVVCMAGEH